MNRARLALAVAAMLLTAYVALRVAVAPEPFTTLALPAGVSAAAAPAPVAAAPEPTGRGDPPREYALRAALAALDAARAAGYADPATADPDRWAARSCGCHAEDVRRLRALAARGLALRGHRTRVASFHLVRAGPASATLLVTDRTAAYAAVDRRGRTAARWRGADRRWRITLVRLGGRWLLGAIDPGRTRMTDSPAPSKSRGTSPDPGGAWGAAR